MKVGDLQEQLAKFPSEMDIVISVDCENLPLKTGVSTLGNKLLLTCDTAYEAFVLNADEATVLNKYRNGDLSFVQDET